MVSIIIILFMTTNTHCDYDSDDIWALVAPIVGGEAPTSLPLARSWKCFDSHKGTIQRQRHDKYKDKHKDNERHPQASR